MPREFCHNWCTQIYRGKQYDDAEGWAYGFWTGMKLCSSGWQPMLQTPQGQAWYRPIGLLGADEFSADQDALTKTPTMRGRLALQTPDAVVAIFVYRLPHRLAVHERDVATTLQKKVGRNEPCPCGSGNKFKKCCGAAGNLQ